MAPMSQHEVDTAYQVAQKGSEAFPVICGPARPLMLALTYVLDKVDPQGATF